MKDYLIDTHAHIDMLISEYSQTLDSVLTDMREYGVKKAIIPSVEVKTLRSVVNIANSNKNIYGMVGIFPTEAKTYSDEIEYDLKTIAENNTKIVAVGEIGLDYYWDKSFVDLQKEVFIKQIKLANELNLPIVVHDREAHKDCFDIIKEYNKTSSVLFHCFSGSVEFMKECVKEGWYIAIGGVVTFKNAVKIKEVATEVPIEKLVLETDSPYLTPVPYRGKMNKPAYVRFVAEEIANLRNMSVNELINITTENAERFFGI
jgi:TatD DNase family protein